VRRGRGQWNRAVPAHEDAHVARTVDDPGIDTAVGAARHDGVGPPRRLLRSPEHSHLRDALGKASREVIEKIAWEVVPQLAETIVREIAERTLREREGKG